MWAYITLLKIFAIFLALVSLSQVIILKWFHECKIYMNYEVTG